MTSTQPGPSGRGITARFAAWLDDAPDAKDFYIDSLVVLDANVLLDLYRVTGITRKAVIDALTKMGARLWVPHQAALEFSRNRMKAAQGRMQEFSQTKRRLNGVPNEVLNVVQKALKEFDVTRKNSMTSRVWSPDNHALDDGSIRRAVQGLMQPVLDELAAIEKEHDIEPGDVGKADPVLAVFESVIDDRVGLPYSSTDLRKHVAEAIEFRFPNQIPPGYEDRDKETPLRRAGDYILWQQTLDHVSRERERFERVLLVTKDVKRDWWVDGKAVRPELRQEMLDVTGADLMLVTLVDYLQGVASYLQVDVPESAMDELRTVQATEFSRAPRDAFSLPEVAAIMGVAIEWLNELVSAGIVWPSHPSKESGGPGLYAFDDLLLINLAYSLTFGYAASLRQVGRVVAEVRNRSETDPNFLRSGRVVFMPDGSYSVVGPNDPDPLFGAVHTEFGFDTAAWSLRERIAKLIESR